MYLHRMARSGMGGWAACMLLMFLVGATQAVQRRSASASPTPTPDPNLAALTGLGGIGALTAGGASGANGNDGACNNQDLLTNLLVYQYLSGSIPNGAPPGLLGSSGPATTTVTSVSTTRTTLVVEVEPSTHFLTSTTSYVTTLTSVETKVIPVLFRGSKITTTISESSEEVITATEYFTETSVHSPSIVQTLPVHITMTATSTRGLNGQYTLLELTPGPTSVIQQPIQTTTFDLDAAGLDLANLDLSQLDLTSLGGLGGLSLSGDSDNTQMLSALTSLLQNFEDNDGSVDPAFDPHSSPRFNNGRNTARNNNGRRNNNFRSTRFQDNIQSDYNDFDPPADEPKFNVLPGFTLSDRVASSGGNVNTGTAAQNTRYSKYHRKSRVDNNGIAAPAAESNVRESERFSASTRRRTFSRSSAEQRRPTEEPATQPPSTRFVPAAESQYFEEGAPKFRAFGPRSNRQATPRRRSGVQSGSGAPSGRSISAPRANPSQRNAVPVNPSPPANVRTTVLTMYLSGTVPGEFHTSLRTVTLRSLATRRRRDVQEESSTKITTTATSAFAITENTISPNENISPKEIVHLLKSLDSKQVKEMLKSLQKWVDYYSHEVLDEENTKDAPNDAKKNLAPELASSIKNTENTEAANEATTALPLKPSSISGAPSSSNLCHAPPTITETVYRTLILTSGVSPV